MDEEQQVKGEKENVERNKRMVGFERVRKGTEERERQKGLNYGGTEIDRPLRALSREVIKSARNLWPRSFSPSLSLPPLLVDLFIVDLYRRGYRWETRLCIYFPASVYRVSRSKLYIIFETILITGNVSNGNCFTSNGNIFYDDLSYLDR